MSRVVHGLPVERRDDAVPRPELANSVGKLLLVGVATYAADVLGVGKATVTRDLGPNGPDRERAAPRDNGTHPPAGPDGPEREREVARDVTLSIADAIRYLDRRERAVVTKRTPLGDPAAA